MRLLLLVILALALPTAAAQEGNATQTGNETQVTTDANETATNESGETPPGGALEEAGPVEYVLEGVQEGSSTFYRLASTGEKNPTLTAQAGQQVTIRLKVVSGFHNVHVEGQTPTPVVGPDEEVSVTFTAPESGAIQYFCDPHKSNGMIGRVSVGGGAAPGGGGEEGGAEIVGDSVDLGDYDAACAGTKVPASAAEGETGGPTLADYIQRCKALAAGEDPTAEPPRPKHAVDYVIRGSFLLIGLGVLGVVWVHKYYKP